MDASAVSNSDHAHYKTKKNFEKFVLLMNQLVKSRTFGQKIKEVAEAFADQFPLWGELRKDRL